MRYHARKRGFLNLWLGATIFKVALAPLLEVAFEGMNK
jgi:hypothetical protein